MSLTKIYGRGDVDIKNRLHFGSRFDFVAGRGPSGCAIDGERCRPAEQIGGRSDMELHPTGGDCAGVEIPGGGDGFYTAAGEGDCFVGTRSAGAAFPVVDHRA